MFDPDIFKRQFPLFSQPENRALVYLDNAATTQRPAAVIEAVTAFYLHDNANTHRSSHRLARRATAIQEQVRQQVADFLGATSASEVVFTHGATEGLNLLAYSLCEGLTAGDEIILSRAEHHANLVPWQMAAERRGLVLRFLEDEAGRIQVEQLPSLLNERTRIVSLTAASNALGQKTGLQAVAGYLRGSSVIWVVDGSQLVAHEPVNFKQLGCDFFVCAPHKFYGPTGVGVVLGKTACWQALPPWQGGGEMIRQVTLAKTTYAEPPHRFETGTAPLAAIAGLGAVLEWWQQQDRLAIRAHEQQLLVYLHQQLGSCEGIQLLTSPDNNVGIATFVPVPGLALTAADIAHWLDEDDIAVRVGHHCAMPLMDALTDQSSLRVSLAAYNSREDIDRMIRTLKALLGDARQRLTGESLHTRLSVEWLSDDLSACDLAVLAAPQSWQKRYKLLMQWADFIRIKPSLRLEEYRVSGCESAAWLAHQRDGERHRFYVDSDARVVRGLAAVLLLLMDDKTTAELTALDIPGWFERLGLAKHLSPSRANGFQALVKRALSLAEVNPDN